MNTKNVAMMALQPEHDFIHAERKIVGNKKHAICKVTCKL